MWITVFLGSLILIFPCNCQEVTGFDVPTVTETTRSNQGIEWDSTGSPVTLNIKDGHTDIASTPRTEIPSHPLFYSNQWQPFMMPTGFNYGDQTRYHSEDDEDINYPFMPAFYRRPDSELNLNSSSRRMQSIRDFRNPLVPVPIPMAPMNPMLFYRHHPNLYFSRNNHGNSNSNILQNSSASDQSGSIVSIVGSSRIRNNPAEISSSLPFEPTPDDTERLSPIDFFRNNGGFLPPISPAFVSPFPIPPNANGNYVPPILYPYSNEHLFDRESGSEVIENKPEGRGIPGIETTVTPEDIAKQEDIAAKAISSDSTPTFVPPEPLPLPVGAFPFGILPPPLLPSILPPLGVPGDLPLNPLTETLNLPKENIGIDAVAQQSPITANLPMDSAPIVLPPVNALQPEAEISATVEPNAVRSPPGEKPNGPKIPYEFGFDMNDGKGTDQHRKEVSDISGTVRGSYGYRDMFGVYRFVNYIADKNGFRAFIKSNEPGVASSGSADVVVMAERPPPQTIAEGEKAIEQQALIVPDVATDLVAEGSETQSK